MTDQLSDRHGIQAYARYHDQRKIVYVEVPGLNGQFHQDAETLTGLAHFLSVFHACQKPLSGVLWLNSEDDRPQDLQMIERMVGPSGLKLVSILAIGQETSIPADSPLDRVLRGGSFHSVSDISDSFLDLASTDLSRPDGGSLVGKMMLHVTATLALPLELVEQNKTLAETACGELALRGTPAENLESKRSHLLGASARSPEMGAEPQWLRTELALLDAELRARDDVANWSFSRKVGNRVSDSIGIASDRHALITRRGAEVFGRDGNPRLDHDESSEVKGSTDWNVPVQRPNRETLIALSSCGVLILSVGRWLWYQPEGARLPGRVVSFKVSSHQLLCAKLTRERRTSQLRFEP